MQNINASQIFGQTILWSCLLLASPGHAQAQQRVAPDVAVEGLSQEDWSRAWWQWAGSFSRQDSPVADRTGELCGQKQKGPVWFLAGTYGTQRTIRTCHVPRGKHLFFPLINYIVMPRSEGSNTCASVMETARRITDDPATLILEVDGELVGNLATSRQATRKCFDMGELTEAKYKIFPSAANGYYVMLKPLAPGTHVLNFGGALPGMLQAVTYTLIVD
jgi:hypothetical protein